MRIGDKSSDRPENRERFNLQVGRRTSDIVLVHGNIAVVLFVAVKILNQSLMQEIIEGNGSCSKRLKMINTRASTERGGHLKMSFCYSALSIRNDNGRSTDPSPITSDMYSRLMLINKHTHKLRKMAHSAQQSEIRNKFRRESGQSNNRPININPIRSICVQLPS